MYWANIWPSLRSLTLSTGTSKYLHMKSREKFLGIPKVFLCKFALPSVTCSILLTDHLVSRNHSEFRSLSSNGTIGIQKANSAIKKPSCARFRFLIKQPKVISENIGGTVVFGWPARLGSKTTAGSTSWHHERHVTLTAGEVNWRT